MSENIKSASKSLMIAAVKCANGQNVDSLTIAARVQAEGITVKSLVSDIAAAIDAGDTTLRPITAAPLSLATSALRVLDGIGVSLTSGKKADAALMADLVRAMRAGAKNTVPLLVSVAVNGADTAAKLDLLRPAVAGVLTEIRDAARAKDEERAAKRAAESAGASEVADTSADAVVASDITRRFDTIMRAMGAAAADIHSGGFRLTDDQRAELATMAMTLADAAGAPQVKATPARIKAAA